MNDDQQTVVAEITREARTRCLGLGLGHGTLEAVETLRAELEKNPTLGRRAQSAVGDLKVYTTRLEGTDALVSPVRFAGGGTEF
ncbi:hypothetical protein ACI2L1_27850 [Streptomyces sp. NPDC019531]|uniref:hypothetical protein n=1 Tax=Streptomyces sp. NPDC019531 TaxID=3365062 RepID=UPI00384DB0EC